MTALPLPPDDLRAERLWCPRLWREAAPLPTLRGSGSLRFDAELELFHDSPRPIRGAGQYSAPSGAARPFALAIDVGDFAGSYLSLSLTLPRSLSEETRTGHLLAVRMWLEPQEVRVLARLNLVQGPDRHQVARRMSHGAGPASVEFDLHHSGVRDAPIDRIWLDVFFEEPAGRYLDCRDMLLIWRRRAEF
jgi:hypothetical protein